MRQIIIPGYFDYDTFDEVLLQRDSLRHDKECQASEEIIFDLSENKYVSILGLLVIAELSDFLYGEKKCKCFIRTKKESSQSFLTKIMGLVPPDKPNQEIEKFLDEFRVPIHRCFNDKQSLRAINKLIPIIRSELKLPEALLKALNWALWELVGNAGLHGYCMYNLKDRNYPKPVYFCAFDYKNCIEMAILDVGRGIHKSFLESGKDKYKNISNAQALSLSIKEAESGDPQGSAGFGLFGCAEIARKANGQLVIISGSNKLIVTAQKEQILSSGKFDGTMVLLTIPQQAAINLADILGKDSVTVLESLDDLLGDPNE